MTSDTQKLVAFIRTAKERQVGDDSIVSLLRQHGWSERRIFAAFSDYYEGVLGETIPSRGSRIEQARDAFFYLLAFITLGFWTIALILLADRLIDFAFPSPLDMSYQLTAFRGEISGQLAMLIVAFPLFLFVSRLIAQEVALRPEALDSGVRKWLTYVALVITAVTMLGDAVAFLTQFLSGDLTVRFALKALVLLVVAGGTFWYYLGTMRAEPAAPSRNRVFGWAAAAAVIIAIAVGFANTGSPARQRALSLDQQRVSRLASIARYINGQWQQSKGEKFALPRNLGQVPIEGVEFKDPATGAALEYTPGLGTSYSLCATFDTESTNKPDGTWTHPAGHHCFTMDAKNAVAYLPSEGYVTQY